MIHEKLLWHTGEQMLAEHVQRAVAVGHKTALRYRRNDHPARLSWRDVWFGQRR
jgi:hypothetical protein